MEFRRVLFRSVALADSLVFADYELQKAFRGISSHESQVLVPIFDNDQDIAALATRVQPWLDEHLNCVGYLIRGHGLYTWGETMSDALRQIERSEEPRVGKECFSKG